MAEPLATSVIGSLPRHITGKGRFVRVVKTASRPSFSTNFFTPIPWQTPSCVDSPPLNSVLNHRAWEYPTSKHFLWREDGLMRSLLLSEILPPQVNGRRIRKTSQTSRVRLRKPVPLSPSTTRLNFSTSQCVNKAQLKYRPTLPISPRTASKVGSPLNRFRALIRRRAKTKFDLRETLDQFILAEEQSAFYALPPSEIFELAEELADFIDHLCVDLVHVDIITRWGERLRNVIEYIPSGSNSETLGDLPRMSLICRAASFTGHLHQAKDFFNQIPGPTAARPMSTEPDLYQKAYESMVLSMQRHEGLYLAMNFLFVKNRWFTSSLTSSRFLRDMLLTNFAALGEVFTLATKWNTSAYDRMVQEVILSFNDAKAVEKSLEIINGQYAAGMKIQPFLLLKTAERLASIGDIENAQNVFDLVTMKTGPLYEETKNFLSKCRDAYAKVEEAALGNCGGEGLDHRAISDYLSPFAAKGDVEKIRSTFNRFFPKDSEGRRLGKPNVRHYTIVFQAHAKVGVTEGLDDWLEDMKNNDVQPNLHTMTNILDLYRKRNDFVNVLNTYHYIRQNGMKLDVVAYTVVLSACAAAKDSENATRVFMQALEDGLIPDDKMTNSLLNTYVETGSFKEAIAVFHHLTSLPSDRIPSVDTFNTLLKGYVLFGAPFRLISKLFSRLQALKIQPDAYTFSTLVLSATDAGRMDLAYSIYEEMQRLEASGQRSDLISEHFLVILMSAHLQRRELPEAYEILNEIQNRGFPPNDVTSHAIVAAYCNSKDKGWEENMRMAEELVKRMQGSRKPELRQKRMLRLISLYLPLITNYAGKGIVADVERLYDEYLDAGGRPTIVLLQQLILCYSRTDDLRNATDTWDYIRELATLRDIDGHYADGGATKTKVDNIQLAVSVYVDLLSRKGLHTQIANIWADLKSRDFQFDSHNWNHLVVVLIRAGQVERAFEIIETILIPRWKENEAAIEALKLEAEVLKSKDEHDLEAKLDIGANIQAPPNKPPLRTKKLRMKASQNRKLRSRWIWELVEDDRAIDADFSYPLRILQIIPPMWHTWRPHKVVLRTLLVVLLQLQRGYPIRPLLPDEKAFSNVAESDVNVQDFQTTEKLLETLYRKYPLTMAEMRHFHEQEAIRLPPERFERIYIRR